jgi:hypothetical protein
VPSLFIARGRTFLTSAAVILQQSIQQRSIEILAVEDHGSDARRIANVLEGIRIEDHRPSLRLAANLYVSRPKEVGMMNRAGVELIAGTDVPNPFLEVT